MICHPRFPTAFAFSELTIWSLLAGAVCRVQRADPTNVATAVFLLALYGGEAHAQEIDPERPFRFYGHISPTILTVDDGVSRSTDTADNANSGGRIGFWYQRGLGENTLKFNGEASLGARNSGSLSQLGTPPLFDWKGGSVRKLEVILETPRLGTFSVGQGSMGSDGVAESDLSGTNLASYVGIADVAGGFFFRTGTGTLSDISIQDAYPTYDGGRSQRVRYDSPQIDFSRLGSLQFAASIGTESSDENVTLNDALSDAGLFYRNQLGSFAMAGSVGVSIADTSAGNEPQIAGSFSILHEPTGFNLTAASGNRNNNGDYQYIKAGIRGDWFKLGGTSVSVDWYASSDTVLSGSDARSVGIGVVQHLSNQNVDLFFGVRKYGYDGGSSVQYQDMTSAMLGVRWVFRRLEKRTIFEDLWQK